MPILISNQTANTNNNEQEENSPIDVQTNHVSSPIPEVNQFFCFYFIIPFCETRSKRSVEVYKGKNLHPPTDVTDIAMETSQTVTAIASNVQLIVYCYKLVQEKLINLWENWKALG
jgi:hypothetical protein